MSLGLSHMLRSAQIEFIPEGERIPEIKSSTVYMYDTEKREITSSLVLHHSTYDQKKNAAEAKVSLLQKRFDRMSDGPAKNDLQAKLESAEEDYEALLDMGATGVQDQVERVEVRRVACSPCGSKMAVTYGANVAIFNAGSLLDADAGAKGELSGQEPRARRRAARAPEKKHRRSRGGPAPRFSPLSPCAPPPARRRPRPPCLVDEAGEGELVDRVGVLQPRMRN